MKLKVGILLIVLIFIFVISGTYLVFNSNSDSEIVEMRLEHKEHTFFSFIVDVLMKLPCDMRYNAYVTDSNDTYYATMINKSVFYGNEVGSNITVPKDKLMKIEDETKIHKEKYLYDKPLL